MNIRPAPLQIILAVKRRLATAHPAAVLDEKSVKLVPIPQTHFDATIFIFQENGKHRLIAEFCRPELPHIYAGKTVDPTAKGFVIAVVWVMTQIGFRILHDPRFSRGTFVRPLNGFAHAHVV